MPHRLKERQQKIQDKRKQTPWREFVMEIASWMPVNFHKIDDVISRFPQTGREGSLVGIDGYGSHEVVEGSSSGSFLSDITALFRDNPKMILQQRFENENSSYAECYSAKNAYLSFGVGQDAENVLYTMMSHSSIRNIINSFVVVGGCENVYESRSITNGYNIFYSSNVHNSRDVRFGSNLVGCSDCILCFGLENQSYCIANKQYDKESYQKLKKKIMHNKGVFSDYATKVHQQLLDNKLCENVSGAGVVSSRDIDNGYFIQNLTEGRNIFLGGGQEGGNCFYDCFDAGNQKDDHLYATNYVGESSSHAYCVVGGANVNHVFYSYHMESCSHCLGCIGLKNKSYCIFNKQYTKEARYDKVDEIFSQMEKDGDLGKFFPGSMNPFYFNDTAAYLIDDSFTKEEVEAKGYLRRDNPITVDIPEWMDVVDVKDLGDYEGRKDPSTTAVAGQAGSGGQEWWIDPSILKKVIRDEQGNVYRVIKMEYDFLMKHGLPLPRKHWLERLKNHFQVT